MPAFGIADGDVPAGPGEAYGAAMDGDVAEAVFAEQAGVGGVAKAAGHAGYSAEVGGWAYCNRAASAAVAS